MAYEDPAKPIPPGGSRVTITLCDRPGGTWLSLKHELADEPTRDRHVQGWSYQLAVFANAAAGRQHSNLSSLIDRYFATWAERNAVTRRQHLAELAVADIVFQDRYGCASGLDDLNSHMGASQIHMPGLTFHRSGEPGHCQGTALAEWEARSRDGKTLAHGSNLFMLAPDGRIARVVGFW